MSSLPLYTECTLRYKSQQYAMYNRRLQPTPLEKKKVKHIKLGGYPIQLLDALCYYGKATKMAIADRLNTTEGRVGKGVECVCVREGSPRPPRGPRWHHPTLTVKGGSRDIKALPSYFLLEGCFEKGRRIEWQGSRVKRGKKYMQPCLTLCQRKDGQGIKRHGRDEISCGKRYENSLPSEYIFFI